MCSFYAWSVISHRGVSKTTSRSVQWVVIVSWFVHCRDCRVLELTFHLLATLIRFYWLQHIVGGRGGGCLSHIAIILRSTVSSGKLFCSYSTTSLPRATFLDLSRVLPHELLLNGPVTSVCSQLANHSFSSYPWKAGLWPTLTQHFNMRNLCRKMYYILTQIQVAPATAVVQIILEAPVTDKIHIEDWNHGTVLSELSQTMGYTTCKTVNWLARTRKQLHFNRVVPERTKEE